MNHLLHQAVAFTTFPINSNPMGKISDNYGRGGDEVITSGGSGCDVYRSPTNRARGSPTSSIEESEAMGRAVG